MLKNLSKIRQDFPILDQKVNDEPLIYFDNAATTQKPQAVIQAVVDYYQQDNANVYRGVHTLSQRATERYETARTTVQAFINAKQTQEIIFTKGTTQGLNWIAQGFASELLKPGDEILITVAEHHSNLVPWQQVAQKTGAILKYLPLSSDGRLDLQEAKAFISTKTKILSVAHITNVLGTQLPIKALADAIHAVDGYLIVDGAQAIGHQAVDVQALDCDFYVFSGHKVYGPTGIGVLYGKTELLMQLKPQEFGGEMIDLVTEQTATFKELPYCLEGGTPNISGAIGLKAAIDYLNQQGGMTSVYEHEQALMKAALNQMQQLDFITIYGPQAPENHFGVISFNLNNVHPHDVATALDMQGIAVRAGHHCAQPLMNWLNIDATVRLSFGLYNTLDEVTQFINALSATKEYFSNGAF